MSHCAKKRIEIIDSDNQRFVFDPGKQIDESLFSEDDIQNLLAQDSIFPCSGKKPATDKQA